MLYYPLLQILECQKISRPENFANQVIRKMSRLLIEFDFANQQDKFIRDN